MSPFAFAESGSLTLTPPLSPFIRTKWAVELDPIAAKACGANRGNVRVFNASVSDFLETAVLGGQVQCNARLVSPPKRGVVDHIFAGCRESSLRRRSLVEL